MGHHGQHAHGLVVEDESRLQVDHVMKVLRRDPGEFLGQQDRGAGHYENGPVAVLAQTDGVQVVARVDAVRPVQACRPLVGSVDRQGPDGDAVVERVVLEDGALADREEELKVVRKGDAAEDGVRDLAVGQRRLQQRPHAGLEGLDVLDQEQGFARGASGEPRPLAFGLRRADLARELAEAEGEPAVLERDVVAQQLAILGEGVAVDDFQGSAERLRLTAQHGHERGVAAGRLLE